MNTKQVEELTGITRQNIRYYEKQGLLEPARETGNAYRDYSPEDVRRLKLIKMLRLLDMPLKEIEGVLNEDIPLKEAAARQQESLMKQQRQLQAAIDVCTSINKEKADQVDVDGYLEKMENMSRDGGIFAKIVDDYKQVAKEEDHSRLTFYASRDVNTAGMFEKALREYASEHKMKLRLTKPGMYPEFTLDGTTYTAARILEGGGKTGKAAVKIVCKRKQQAEEEGKIPESRRMFLQGIHYVSVNIRRHRFKSILNGGISILIVLVMAFYLGNLSSTKVQLTELPEKLPVSAQVWNVRGDLHTGLFIPGQVLDAVYKSSHTKHIAEGVEFMGSLRKDAAKDAEEYAVTGMNRAGVIEDFTENDITWADGWDWKKFQESRDVCIANETFSGEAHVLTGDILSFSMERYRQSLAGISLEREPLHDISAEVVGICDFSSANKESGVPDVILPLENAKQLFEDSGKTYFASSLSFMVKDPMKLNALKKELKGAGLQSVVQGSPASFAGAGLKMDDAVFIDSVTSLEKSLSLLEGFLPFVLLVIVMLGYIVPHLLLQGRREEYAIMRALGSGRRRCSTLFFTEHFLLAAAGGAAGALAGLILGAADIRGTLLVWGLFLICYAAGSAAAMWMFGRFSVAAVLSHRD